MAANRARDRAHGHEWRDSTESQEVAHLIDRDPHLAFQPWLKPVKELIQGFDFFKREIFQHNQELFTELANGQRPKYMIIACSDSRVCPSHVLQLKLGEAFVLRNIANMVPQYGEQLAYGGVGAAIEYAVHLKVQNIVVVGHSRCGGIEALMKDECGQFELVGDWVKIGQHTRDVVKSNFGHLSLEEQCAKCEEQSVNDSLKNLLTYPFVAEAVRTNALALYGAHYNFVGAPSISIWPAGRTIFPHLQNEPEGV